MGINGLSDLLRKYCPKIFKTKNLSEYAYKKVAIDTTLYLFKYKSVFGDRWLTGFISLIACLRKNDIHCVFIEDGKAPAEKSGERKKRAEQKEKLANKIADIEDAINKYHTTGEVENILQEICEKAKSDNDEKVVKLLGNKKSIFNIHICNSYLAKLKSQNIKLTPEDFQIIEELFKILGVPYYKSPSEAETFCCYLASHGMVDFVLSEDTDVLAYGTPYFLTKINTKDETVVQIEFEELISELDMTGDSFRDLCIMCGNDYNDNIPKIGPDRSYKLIKQYNNIDEVGKNTIFDITILNHKRSRELFSIPKEFYFKIPYCEKADIPKLEEFFFKNNIRYNLEYLISCFKEPELVFEDDEDENKSLKD